MGAACSRCFSWAVRRSFRPFDTDDERQLKQIFIPVYPILGTLGFMPFFITGRGAVFDGISKVAQVWTVVLCIASFLLTIFSNISQRTIAGCALILVLFFPLALDWVSAANLDPRWWSSIILILDAALVANLPLWVHGFMIGTAICWLLLERVEVGVQFGLYDAGINWGHEYSVPVPCDCAEPPCRASVQWAIVSFVGFAFVFLMDYYLTRGFASQMRAQMNAVEASIEAASRIATLLSQYAVEDAQRLVQGEAGSGLPTGLAEAFTQLLHNLESYRPYLPESLLLQGQSESDTFSPSVAPGEGGEEVCICFTDIQSSTALWEAHPNGMFDGLQLHNRTIRKIATDHCGYEVKTIGDSFMFAFSSAAGAARFAVETQRALVQQEWSADLMRHELCRRQQAADGTVVWNGLRVRIGMHCGMARVEHNPVTGRCDYLGPPVNVAARVEAVLRHGGLCGVTDAIMAALGEDGRASLSAEVIPMGEMVLKGVKDPVAVHVLIPSELAARRALVDPNSTVTAVSVPTAEPTATGAPRRGSRRQRGSTPFLAAVMPGAPATQRSPARSPSKSVEYGHHAGFLAEDPRRSVSRASRSGSSEARGSINSAVSSSFGLAGPNRMTLQLHHSVATCANVRYALRSTLTPDRIARLVGPVEQSADITQGVIATVLSASVVVTWNTASTCSNHVGQCLRFITVLRQKQARQHCPYHIGTTSGAMLSGNVAAERRRFATVAGGCLELAAALAEEACLCNDEALAAGAIALHCADAKCAHRAQVWYIGGVRDRLVVWAVHRCDEGDPHDSKWGGMLSTDSGDATVVPAEDPADVLAAFMRAAEDGEPGIAELRALCDEAPSNTSLRLTLERAERGDVRTRTVPAGCSPGD
eukprot:TRINITY_DN2503_c1_g5_i1.p1 TRINITY_DN2503_c1_g5~~TRINITY_DN2503_c1_g5_i1.p1  ORF type:complete len:876 (+),score=208.89 TRINITY_DN2503_c1_g5_i1:81-2708(+)